MSHNTAKYNFDTLSCLLCEGFRKDLFKVQLVEMIRAIVSKIKMSAFFQEEKALLGWLNMIDRLVSSPRATDASTAAMLLKLLVEKCSLPLTFKKNEKKRDDEHLSTIMKSKSFQCRQAFRVLTHLVSLLGSHCLAASKNLYVTGVQAPMHNVLYCIRAILGYMSFRYHLNFNCIM